MLTLDLKNVPFSRAGSAIAFSYLDWKELKAGPGIYMRCMYNGAMRNKIAKLEVLENGKVVPAKVTASADCLRLVARRGTVEICIAEPKVVRLRGKGVGLRLRFTPHWYETANPSVGDTWSLNCFANRVKYQAVPLRGRMKVYAPWTVAVCKKINVDFLPDKAGVFEAALDEHRSSWIPRKFPASFDACRRDVASDFAVWQKKMLKVSPKYRDAAELAAYLDWSCMMAPCGHFTRPAMLMSKNWMGNVWSWDHCFNAMALAAGDPSAAWDTFMLMFDNADALGALPDSVNDKERHWAFCKPPIHGWALRDMLRRRGAIDRHKLREVYGPLGRWTNWWMTYRDDDRNGLPQYNHGNDSGWDNATVFDKGCPVEGPDLAAYLVIQMDVLSDIARWIGKRRDARVWKQKADRLLGRMLKDLWRGDHFVSQRMRDRNVVEPSDSLINFLPVVLGERLPAEVRQRLIAGLTRKGRFLTRYGLATESPESPKYEPDGYWRGPIWAPPTMVVVDGLERCGEKALAREIAKRFCDICARSGFAENFDALTGEGLRDRAYTWTSSVFLLLAHDYLR